MDSSLYSEKRDPNIPPESGLNLLAALDHRVLHLATHFLATKDLLELRLTAKSIALPLQPLQAKRVPLVREIKPKNRQELSFCRASLQKNPVPLKDPIKLNLISLALREEELLEELTLFSQPKEGTPPPAIESLVINAKVLQGTPVNELSSSLPSLLPDLTSLKIRHAQGARLTSLLESASKLSKLKKLYLSGDKLEEQQLSLLAQVGTLEELYLSNCSLDSTCENALQELGKLKKLKRLDLSYNELTGSNLRHFTLPQTLVALDLSGNDLSQGRLEFLTEASCLKELSLCATQIGDDLLPHVAHLSSLEELDLSSTPITTRGLASLGALTNLTSLSLMQTHLQGGIDDLIPCQKLRELVLFDNELQDEHLEPLSKLQALRILDLSNNQLSQRGEDSLKAIQKFEKLDLSNQRPPSS